MSKGSRDSKTVRNRSQRAGQSVMQAQVGEVIIDSSEDEIEIRLIQVCQRLEGQPSFHVPIATKPIDIAWKSSATLNCANAWQGTASSSSAFSVIQSPVSDMELMFELEMQSASVKALGVDDLLEQPTLESARDSDDDDVDDDDMSTFIDDGDDEDGVTDPPLNTTFSIASDTLQEAFDVDDPPEQPPPEPIPDDEGGDNGAPYDPNNDPDVFIDDDTDTEDEDGVEERKNEESMKQLGDGGDSRGGGSDYFVRPERYGVTTPLDISGRKLTRTRSSLQNRPPNGVSTGATASQWQFRSSRTDTSQS